MSEISQATAATSMGLHVSTLSRIERGENPDGETLAKVLRWLMGSAQVELIES